MYTQKDFSHLLGLPGFSDTLLNNHFTLYNGYVTNTNKFLELLETKEIGTPEYSELQRRFGWEWNGMRLHELYFGNMSKEATELKDESLKSKIEKIYGSIENWKKNFIGVGTMRGIGWVILYYDKQADELFNVWVNEHDVGHFTGCTPLLIMDVFEHAFMIDYGIKRADYLTTFWQAIDWSIIENRLAEAK